MMLQQGYCRSEEEGERMLMKMKENYLSSLLKWKERKCEIVGNIANVAVAAAVGGGGGGDDTSVLMAGKHRHYQYYSVKNVSIPVEKAKNLNLYGNLYLPKNIIDVYDDSNGKGNGIAPLFPAILVPHGHFYVDDDNEKMGTDGNCGRLRPDHQYLCAMLATMGCVVLSYDMIGWNDSNSYKHEIHNAFQYQLMTTIAAVDFLLSSSIFKNQIDPQRIGITGASGGGTQSFTAAAIDERITCQVNVVMISSHFNGGCVCESGMAIHCDGKSFQTNNVEIAACMAPRPLLMISVGSDWTKNTPNVEFPFIQSVYKLYGSEKFKLVENVHFEKEDHDYGKTKRIAAYKFFLKHFNLQSQSEAKDAVNSSNKNDAVDLISNYSQSGDSKIDSLNIESIEKKFVVLEDSKIMRIPSKEEEEEVED